VQLTRFAR